MSKLSSSKGKLEFKYVSERRTILKSRFREKKETKNVKTNILTNTHLIFLNLENRNILIVLHTKIPRLNEKKNIDIVVKMLQENDITLKAISISLR